MSKQIECLGTFGKYLSDLVQDVRENGEELFIKAVRIDPAILACEPFTAYMNPWSRIVPSGIGFS